MRDMLNHMLEDGLPYRVIIDELGDAAKGLNHQNITNWLHGGYQDYLKSLETADHEKFKLEFALEFIRENPDADPSVVRRACDFIAATQLLNGVMKHGSGALKNIFQAHPAKYLTMLNTLCNISNASLKRAAAGVPPAVEPAVSSGGIDAPTPATQLPPSVARKTPIQLQSSPIKP
jgi:hypothetical protein